MKFAGILTLSSILVLSSISLAINNFNTKLSSNTFLPLNCASNISGTIFFDTNFDGTNDPEDEGLEGVEVMAFNCDGNFVASGTTDENGEYIISGTSIDQTYRVELNEANMESLGLKPGPAGNDNLSNIRFETPGNCIDFGLVDPEACVESLVAAVCFARNNDPTTEPTIVFVNTDDARDWPGPANNNDNNGLWGIPSGSNAGNYPLTYLEAANVGEVNTTFGMDFDMNNSRLITGSFMRAFAPMNTNASSNGFAEAALYQIPMDLVGEAANTPALWFDLEDLLGDGVAGDYLPDANYPGPTTYGRTGSNPNLIGYTGLGSIKISKDRSELYVVNLDKRSVYVIPIGPNGEAPTTSSDIKEFSLPSTDCSGSWPDGRDLRAALGLGIHPESGRVYASLTCTGPTYDDVTGYVYSFDPSDDTPSSSDFDLELTIPLNIVRPATSPNTATFWAQFGHPWESVNPNAVFYLNDPRVGGNIFNPIPNEKNTQHNQPWLGEVEFGRKSDGTYAMVIGERNRYHDLISSSWYVAGGVIYRACGSEGNWSLSSGNSCSGDASVVNFSFTGSNAGVYTSPENRYMMYVGREGSMGSGMLALPKGSPYVISPVMDNLFNSATSGITWLNFEDGGREKDIRILGNYAAGGFNNTNFTKANNWGAIAGMCTPNSIEIGNYVWLDSDGNGIQDACEEGISNVVVELYDGDGTLLLGSTMTDSEGQYYFNNDNVNQNGANGLNAETEYTIKIPNATGGNQQNALDLLIITALNAGSDNIDSDGVRMGDMVIIEVTTGVSGCSDHTFDIGFQEYIVCSSSATEISCFGASDGMITVDAEAANGEDLEYSINATDFFSTNEFSDLGPGSYNISVRLADDTTVMVTCGVIELVDPPALVLTFMDKDVTCGPVEDGGSIKVEVANATGQISYDWSANEYDDLSNIFNVPVGSYTLTVTDENGCTAEGAVDITEEMCPPDPCEEGELGGSVFNDTNANGEDDGKLENGFQGIKAQLFKCDENGKNELIETVYTDGNGDYHFTDPSIDFEDCVYQIVFSNLPDGYISSSAGPDNGTDVQIASELGCDYDYGILNPDLACATPDFEESVVVGDELFSSGTLLGPGIALITCGTIINLPADERHTVGLMDIKGINMTGDRPEVNPNGWYHPSWSVDNLGNVFGIDYDTSGNIYVTASSHFSHVLGYILGPDASNYTQAIIKYGDLGGGTDDLGAAGTVYKLDAVTGVASVFAQLPQQAFAFNHVACEAPDPPLARTTGPGLGNIVFDQANNQFFVSNFEDGKIYRLNTAGDTINSFDPQTLGVFAADDGSSGWAPDAKPYGLAVNHDGSELYFGTHELNTAPGLYSVSLDMDGDFDGTETFHAIYPAEGDIGYLFAEEPGWVAISDLEFLPNGQIMVGLRTGCAGEYATSHNHGATFYIADEEGDGVYDLIVSNPDIQYPNDDTGNDDGYGGIGIWDKHDGTYDFLVSSSDTRTEEGPHGMILFPHNYTNGNAGFPLQPSAAIPYLPSFNVQDFKGIGGDVEVYSPCGEAPVHVGNFAWIDTNGDGIQDACESPLANLTVKLYTKPNSGDPELVATTVTNEEGEYYFSDSMNVDQDWEAAFSSIEKDSSYYIVFCGESYNPDGEIINVDGILFTSTGANEEMSIGGDMTDSDIDNISVPTIGEFPGICITIGETDFTFDAGFIPKPDLALIQVLDPDYDISDLKFGDPVKFKITVFNQSLGSVDSLEITDYVPSGFTFDENLAGNELWSADGDDAVTVMPSGLAPGAKDSICIYLILEKSNDPMEWVNVTEISDAWSNGQSVEDCDSDLNDDPDDNGGSEINTDADDEIDGDGTATEPGGDPTADQDNVDPATVPICDLALINTIAEMPSSLKLGDTIKYSIIVENQGTVIANNIEIDYTIPVGLSYLDSNDDLVPQWSEGAGDAMATITDELNIGEKDTICIYLAVENVSTNDVTPESWTTFAEISSFEDPADPGVDKSDVDSNPDGNPTNDPGGNPEDDTDDVTTGDGTGDPEDPDEDSDPLLDEDDHDPAIIYICDAATIVYTDHDQPIRYGDTIKFNIVIFNQGNGSITNIDLNDFLGSGLEFISTDINDAENWSGDNDQISVTITEVIDPGESDTTCLELVVVDVLPFDEDAYLHIVEIDEFEDSDAPGQPKVDVDSTPDDDPENDSGGNPGDNTDDETDGDGTGDSDDPNEDSDPELDEDDNDPVFIEVFDLALAKVVQEDKTYSPGEKPVFEITIHNQGNVTVDNFKVVDYIRDGFTFSTMNNAGWNEVGDDLVYTSSSPIEPGDSYTITLELTVVIPMMPMGVSDWWNYAEISDADDNSNESDPDPVDADSNPNDIETDDNMVEPDSDDDNVISENGLDGDDEDDHDPAKVIVGYDLALRKTVAPEGPYSYGDTLTYTVTIFNQGGLAVSDIAIYDSIPCGFLYLENLNDWDYADNIASTVLEDVLAPGGMTTKDIQLVVQRCDEPAYDNYMNISEISDFHDENGEEPMTEDIDSTPNDDPSDDGTPNDDAVEDPMEEDDHDIEDIEICDLALVNMIVDIPETIKIGDTVKYEIIVYNQGNTDANSVHINYSIPNGLTYLPVNEDLNPMWESESDDMASVNTANVIGPNESDTICLYLLIDNVPTEDVSEDSWTTIAEIAAFENDQDEIKTTDADSTPDDIPTNDPGGNPEDDTNDEVDGDGTGDPDDPEEDTDPAKDEDDHDPAYIKVCDVASIIYSELPEEINYYDILKYNIVLSNQGNDDITNILVANHLPEGFALLPTPSNEEEGWEASTLIDGAITVMYDEILASGESDTICLEVELLPVHSISSENSWLQVVEVVQFEDPDSADDPKKDLDSTPDDNPENDPGGNPEDETDDETDGDGTGDPDNPQEDEDPALDEDDHDPVDTKIFDLALIMQIDSMPPVLPVVPGDVLKFIVVITNQGNTPANNVEITNYLMDENLVLASTKENDDWDPLDSETNEYTIQEEILPGEMDTVCIYLEVIGGAMTDIITYSEISGSTETDADCYDIDSTPDDVLEGDAGGNPQTPEDDHVEDDGEDGNDDGITDEDDHDPAMLDGQDLALIIWADQKEPVLEDQDVKFIIRVINQGNVTNENIKLVDYLPEGFELSENDNNGWEYDEMNNDQVTKILAESLEMHDTVETCIILTVQDGVSADELINYAEIVSSNAPDGLDLTGLDIDSSPNNIDNDDTGGQYEDMPDCSTDPIIINDDNYFDGAGVNGEDEDDHDPAWVHVFDLATIIYTDHTTPIIPGDEIKFNVEVHNQGNMSATDIDLMIHMPDGFTLSENDDNDWSIQDGVLMGNYTDDLIPEEVDTVCLVLEVLPDFMLDDLVPIVEITGAMDTLGNDRDDDDLDSNPNVSAEDDEGGEIFTESDDALDGNGEVNDDEDDHDPALPPVMDLAIKIVTVDEEPKKPGDIVKFSIMVYNQGSMTPSEFTIENYVPEGLIFVNNSDNNGWLPAGDSNATYVYDEDLLPLTSDTLCIYLEVAPGANPMNVVNMVEIIEIIDQMDNDVSLLDIDSESDNSNENDLGNDLYSLEDNKIEENGRSGEDEDDHDQAFVNMCQGIACNGHMNISVDQNCEAVITPGVVLTGDIFPDHVYEVEITNSDGEVVSNMFTGDDIGELFTVSVSNPLCNDISCWMTILIEDKWAPQIICQNDTLSCVMAFDESTRPTIIDDNCSGGELILLDEVVETYTCDSMFTSKLTRVWVAKDEAGNMSEECTQEITLLRTNLDSIMPATNFMLATNNAISCSSGYEVDANGNPSPSLTGVPKLRLEDGSFIDLFPFDQMLICNGFVEYTDEVLFGSTDCVTKILRTWTVGEWWCSQTVQREFIQILEVVDFEGPSANCPSDITVSTSGFGCESYAAIDLPHVSDACNDDIRIDLSTPSGFYENYSGEIIMLPVGVNELTYHNYDGCNNRTDCIFNVTVRDDADPIAICDQFTAVGIGLEGLTKVTAQAIDDGSFDECGPVSLAVARMDSPGFDDLLGFGSDVDITCADVGSNVMVGLLVTDAGGNTNMCMVSIEVQDKIDAQFTCPDDMVVECNFPYDPSNLSAFFGEVVIYDNCPVSNTVKDTLLGSLNSCGAGILIRELRLLNASGEQVDYCTQQITFESGTPLQYSDIIPPASEVTVSGCGVESIDPSVLGMPIVIDGPCQLSAIGIENDTFPFTENGACLKIIRTFKVIDWCQEDGPGSVLEPFEFIQIIKVNNTAGPEIENVFADSIFCSYELGCGPININGYLTATSSDDCTVESDLLNRFEVRNSQGIIVKNGIGLDASGAYDVDTYAVRFYSEDKCGNEVFEESTFEVRSCKLPTPYCLQGLSTTLTAMDTLGDGTPDVEMVMLPVEFFDAGSYHPCGYDVQLSFSSDVNDTIMTFFCSDTVGLQPIELWVTDENGGQDYCTTFIDVQDNDTIDLCGGLKPVDIAGRIYTESDAELKGAEVELKSSESLLTLTDDNGMYEFANMLQGGDYQVVPIKDNDHLNGVSTLDLVLIQRHILDLAPLNSVYQLIAADINNNEKISASDLVALRKVILGIDLSFPNNTSWRFIDVGFEFVNEQNPWETPIDEKYNIEALSEDMQIDFIAVKTGDVNGNVDMNVSAGAVSETRSRSILTLEMPDVIVEKGSLYEVEIKGQEELDVFGMQHSLDFYGLELVDINPGKMDVRKEFTSSRDGKLHISYASAQGDKILKDELLYTLVVKATSGGQLSEMIGLSTNGLEAEFYESESLAKGDIELVWRDSKADNLVQELGLRGNSPNPWRNSTEVVFFMPSNGMVHLKVTDVSGRLLLNKIGEFEAGEQRITLTNREIAKGGVFLYELQYEDQVVNGKMIRIE